MCVWLSGKSNKTIHSLEIIESSASVGLLPLGVVYSHLNCKRTMWISITNFLFEASDKSSQWGMNNSEGAGGPEANRCAFHHNYDTLELVLFLFLFVVPFLAVTKCKSWNYMCIYLSTPSSPAQNKHIQTQPDDASSSSSFFRILLPAPPYIIRKPN